MADKKDDVKPDVKDADGDGKVELDPEIAEIIKDPKAVKALLDAKRAANDEAKKLRLKQEAADKVQKDKDDAALAEQGKFKELAERHKGEAEILRGTLKKKAIDFELKLAAVQAGAVDPADVLALCPRTGIKISDDLETVEGAKEAVDALAKAKPHLFKTEAEDKVEGYTGPSDKKPPLRKQDSGPSGMTAQEKIAWGIDHPDK
jgi:hypothetical protein